MHLLKKICKTIAVGRTCAALSTLSDKQLDDIGVKRGEIYAHVAAVYGDV